MIKGAGVLPPDDSIPTDPGRGTLPLRENSFENINPINPSKIKYPTPGGTLQSEEKDVTGRGGVLPPDDGSHTNQGRVSLPLREDSFGNINPINPSTIKHPTLNQIIGYYKYSTTVAINNFLNTPSAKFWQRNFYERVIRNEREYEAIWEYIHGNAAKWEQDEYFNSGQQD